MADLSTRLQSSLAGRYRIDRELGRGGMATVFLAHDITQDRAVALKVLHPELVPSLAASRFAREIEIASDLHHPHIVPVLASGEADGLPFYVMPYVEGESLSARLGRESPLPIDEAVRITRAIADALAFAHRRGIIHRDIKPANVLLAGDQVLVADFGIARAINVVSAERLTTSGMTLGTPYYMSPEQAVPEMTVDGRSDLYSLACVLYEMVAGHPPFLGSSGNEVLMRHVHDSVPPITSARPGVPPSVRRAVERALAKSPADRFPTASEFAAALEENAASRTEPPFRRRAGRRIGLGVASATVVVAVGVVAAVTFRSGGSASKPDNPGIVAVLPFRIAGDSAFQYLGEGLVDLIATKISALDGPRAVEARTVLSAWRRATRRGDAHSLGEARAVATAVGSTRFVLGEAVVTPAAISLSARLLGVDGEQYGAASAQGPPDSLFTLVDRLCVQLLAVTAGEPGRRLADLTSTSIDAVRSYLAGRAAWRRGEGDLAIRHFTTALETDSTFALAALGMASAGVWSQQAGQSEALRRGLRTGYRLRDRLATRDRALFEAYVQPDQPGSSTAARQLAGWGRAAAAAPESPEAQYEYGDRLYHSGAQLGIGDHMKVAREAFSRALALDSAFVQPRAHLIEMAARSGRREEARQLLRLYPSEVGEADASAYVRWRAAVAMDDRAALGRVRGQWGALSLPALIRIMGFGLADGVGLADVDSAAIELMRRIDARAVSRRSTLAILVFHSWAANRGRRVELTAATRMLREAESSTPPGSTIVYFDADQVPVLDAMFWDGDPAAAREAWSRLAGRVAEPTPPESGQRARFLTSLCVTLLWRETLGDRGNTTAQMARLRAGTSPADSSVTHGGSPALCVAMLDAMAAVRSGYSGGPALVAVLDSLMLEGPYQFGVDFGNLVLARLYDRLGDRQAALRVVRRRPYDWDTGPLYLTTFLREEGRLAAATGDRAGAGRAEGHLRALRRGGLASPSNDH